MEPLAVYRERKNIEPVVVARDIMKLLRLDATLQVEFRICNSFLILKRISDALPGWIDEETRRPLRPVDDVGGPGIPADEKLAHGRVHVARGVDAKGLGFERMRAGA